MGTLTDVDYAILMTKITAIESRVSKLEENSAIIPEAEEQRRAALRKEVAEGYVGTDYSGHHYYHINPEIKDNHVASIKVPQTISQEMLSTNIIYNPPDDIRSEDIQNSTINIDDVLRSI